MLVNRTCGNSLLENGTAAGPARAAVEYSSFAAYRNRTTTLIGSYRASLMVVAVLVGLTGHFGGVITHGSAYLGQPIAAVFGMREAKRLPTPAPQTRAPAPDRSAATPPPADSAIPFPGAAPPSEVGPIDFATHVKPILEASCISCHGAAKRRGGLRLDTREDAMKGGKHGPCILPGNSRESDLIIRVRGEGDEQPMPLDLPPLSEEQIRILADWIDQGAPWPDEHAAAPGSDAQEEIHWAYIAPHRPDIPRVVDSGRVRNPIDSFVLDRLRIEMLEPSPEADRATLLRRLALDLTGLPPTPEEIDAFLRDTSEKAYENAADRYLASPAYGEKWARLWLDLARYADSHGYEKDQTWSMWPYRDWVVDSINSDMPFDRFVIEQLAGDLLPAPTPEKERSQKIATGFLRCSMINEEGGVDPEEARVVSVFDRVDTTATVFLGTTFGCAQCHDHKFDPFTQKDYYSFFAFFNNSPGETRFVGDGETQVTSPKISVPRADLQELLARAGAIEEQLQHLPPDSLRANDLQEALKVVRSLINTPPTTQIMVEMETPRETRIFSRGSFLSPGEQVTADTPAALPPLFIDPTPHRITDKPGGGAGTSEAPPRDRLALARWIIRNDNPLTARVAVNRIWSQYFGRGLVATEEDFGTRGEPPTHPELLDFLATEFISSGWSQKALHRLIVTSATYRQSSRVREGDLERDPHNKLLARGPRFRLSAEEIRDQALAIGGLLSRKLGGPSVFPQQPDGVWGHAYSGEQWKLSEGEDRYRRGLYTFWKRATPYPSFAAFDAPSRQVTCTRRARTNTPLQALVTLNDPVYMQAAAGLARRTLQQGGTTDPARIAFAFRLCTARPPRTDEASRLLTLLDEQRSAFEAAPNKARELLSGLIDGSSNMRESEAELAAWTVTANVLLNLDEVLTKG